jgi:hypothetical protein
MTWGERQKVQINTRKTDKSLTPPQKIRKLANEI